MTTREQPRLIAVTHVKPGREQDFEAFVSDVIAPAVQQVRPDTMERWQTVRPGQEQSSDAPQDYFFLFYGDGPLEDWDLASLFVAAYGEQEAERRIQDFDGLLAGEQTMYALGGLV